METWNLEAAKPPRQLAALAGNHLLLLGCKAGLIFAHKSFCFKEGSIAADQVSLLRRLMQAREVLIRLGKWANRCAFSRYVGHCVL